MTKEELLKPRYKVIADYPGSSFEIENVLETDEKSVYTLWEHDGKHELTLSNFPAIFRELEWWEEREEKDLPEYVRYKGCEFFRFSAPAINEVLKVESYSEDCLNHCKGCDWITLYEPATKEEYKNYIRTNQ